MVNRSFWEGKKVFLTGHTGFKGSWISIWLSDMGAKVTGYSDKITTSPSIFELGRVEDGLEKSIYGDIADLDKVKSAMIEANPEIIIHMAAQPLVRQSYKDPIHTYMTNVMGTANVMEAAKMCDSVSVILNITTDKVYENKEWYWGYREQDHLGGYDPYSSSKACSELVTASYRDSFFREKGISVATARAGNVIGGGDWSEDRLVPDLLKSLQNNEVIKIRNPKAIRPWQHVLEPLSGYLTLCQRLYEDGDKYATAWNFGPRDTDTKSVEYIVNHLLSKWKNEHPGYEVKNSNEPHEANLLKLDCSKSLTELKWESKWNLDIALDMTIEWFDDYTDRKNMRNTCIEQINQFEKLL